MKPNELLRGFFSLAVAIAAGRLEGQAQTVCIPPPAGLVSWWRAETNAVDTFGTNNGALLNGTSFAAGEVGQGFVFDGVASTVRIPASPTLDIGQGPGLTLEAWIKPVSATNEGPIFEWSRDTGGAPYGVHLFTGFPGTTNSYVYANIADTTGNWRVIRAPNGLIQTNVFQHLALTYDKPSGVARIFLNGGIIIQTTLGTFTPQTSYNLYLGQRPPGDPNSRTFEGIIDEPSIYNRALSTNEIQAIYQAGSAGKCLPNSPPVCVPLPSGAIGWWQGESNSLDIVAGDNGTLTGAATFTPGLDGTAFSFNGSGQKVTVADAPLLNPTNALTVETWLNVSTFNTGGAEALVCKDDAVSRRQYMLGVALVGSHWVMRAHIGVPSGYQILNGTAPIQPNAWYHAAMTYDGSSLKLYVNGVLDGSMAVTGPIVPTTQMVIIGGCVPGPWDFAGLLDEVTLYNRALTVTEVQTIYGANQAGKCPQVAPRVISQPADQTAQVGDDVTFAVTAVGNSPLTYHWQVNGASISGQTGSVLVLTNVQLGAAGTYSVLVSNAVGMAQSSNADLTVLPPTACDPAAPGIVSWWRGEGDTTDALGNNTGLGATNLTYATGEVGQAFSFDGTSTYVRIPASASLDVGSAAGLTIEAWINPSDTSMNRPIVEWNRDSLTTGVQMWINYPSAGNLNANLIDTGGNWHLLQSSTPVIQANRFQHVAVTYDKVSGQATLFLNGVVVQTANFGSFTPQTTYDLSIGRRPNAAYFSGLIDEVGLYGRGLSTNEIQAIYQAGISGKCLQVAPSIAIQPSNRTAYVGDNLTFSVLASGAPAPAYQWLFNGVALAGQTFDTLALTNVQLAGSGSYSVLVSNVVASVLSSNAVLIVSNAPARVEIVSSQAAAGALVSVPVVVVATGNENALGFGLSFPSSLLTYSGVTLGTNAAGASLVPNTNQLPSGRLGLILSLSIGQSFSAGTQQVVLVNFTTALSTNSAIAQILFGDQPTARGLSDSQAHALPVLFANGTVAIAGAQGFEGDVAPRPDGDGTVSVTDWVQVGRFVVGLDSPTNSNEFQRADCAPRATYGDGVLSLADWVQAGRYAAGLDPLTPAAGATASSAGPGVVRSDKTPPPADLAKSLTRQVQIANACLINGQPGKISVCLQSQGDENALAFSLAFNPAVLSFSSASLGSDATGATLELNTAQAASGKLACLLALQPGATFTAGVRQVLTLTFNTAASTNGNFALDFTDTPVRREVDAPTAAVLPADFISGTATVTPVPCLVITSSAQAIHLAWPQWATNFGLQEANALLLSGGNAWTNSTVSVTATNNQNTATVPMSSQVKFYRLRSQ